MEPTSDLSTATTSARKSSTGRWLRRLAWVAVPLALLAGGLVWGVPALLTAQLPPRLSEALGRPVTLSAVEFVPWQLDLTLRGLRIGAAGEPADAAATQAPALLKIERLHVDLSIASLTRRAPVVEAVDVDGLQLNVARTSAGHYDVDDLIQRFTGRPKKEPAGEPPHFSLNNLALRDAQIRFDDRPVGQVHQVKALTLTLPFLSNLPDLVEITTEPRLAFDYNGTRFDTGTQAVPFAQTRSGTLTLAFKDLDLKPAIGYLPAGLPVKLLGARLSSDLTLRFALPRDAAASVAVKGQLALRDLALAEPTGAALAGWKALTLQLVDVQPLLRRVNLGTLKLEGADLQLLRDERGQINLQRLFAPKSPAASPGTAAPPPPQQTAAAASAPASGAGAGAKAGSAWTLELASLQIDGARVRWTDAAVRPQTALQIDELGLKIDGLRWPAPTPLPVALQGTLRAQRDGAPVSGRFNLQGQVHPEQAALTLDVEALDLAALAPYLALALRPHVTGQVGAKARVDWAASPALLSVKLDNASVQNLQLRDGTAHRAASLASLRRLTVTGVDLDVPGRRASIGSVQLMQPAATVSRDAQGQLNVLQWRVAAPAATAKASAPAPKPAANPAPAGPPWRVVLRDLSITGGNVQWRDAGLAPGVAPVQVDVGNLKLRLQGLTWPATPVAASAQPRLQLAARIGAPATPDAPAAPGEIDWNGRLALSPMQAEGKLLLKAFPLHLFVPYAAKALPVDLHRAEAGYQGNVKLSASPAGWQVATEGDVQVNDLHVNSLQPAEAGAGSTELLTWQSLSLQGLSFAMAPPARPQLVVREVVLSDFYSRLEITAGGRLNLQDVAARGTADKPSEGAVPSRAPASAAPAPVAAAASAPPAQAEPDRLAVEAAQVMDLDIGGIQLRNGRVDFSDYFIRPNYSARLTELNGSIGRLRSGTREMASISLRGRAAGTALLDISGEFNPTAKPLALDLRAKATDLELAPLSPYAGKYAGYGIERGKLSVDVAYKIDADGKLAASNQVILNQLTFGEKVESPSATKLPVRLAVALLSDSNGVIDINLPISGSVNDPKFSVGGLIWQVIGNLLTKAVTAPFSLLSGGGGKDLSMVAFQPGTTQLAEAGRQTLAKVAKALADRPTLIMTVTGSADPVSERDAVKRALLEEKLQAERRREQLREAPAAAAQAAAAASAPKTEPPLTAEQRDRALKRLYQQTPLPDKPRNAIGMLSDLPPAEMESRLLAGIVADEVAMRELALQRGLAVRDELVATGLASDRLFLAAPKLHKSGEAAEPWVPQVSLALNTR